MQSLPSTVYSQSVDKQRIVVVGKSSARIVEIILHVLAQHKRKFDYSTPLSEKISEAPIIIIDPGTFSKDASGYQHHILVLNQLNADDKIAFGKLADLTPKGGILIFDETNQVTKEITKSERADITVISYAEHNYELVNGLAVLISSTNERFPTLLSSTDDMKNLSSAKSLLKKIGISSGQFYQAIGTLK